MKDGLILGVLISLASCTSSDIKMPKGEVCFADPSQHDWFLCENTLFPVGDPLREYERASTSNDVLSNVDDFMKFQKEFIEVKKNYEICRKYPKKCI